MMKFDINDSTYDKDAMVAIESAGVTHIKNEYVASAVDAMNRVVERKNSFADANEYFDDTDFNTDLAIVSNAMNKVFGITLSIGPDENVIFVPINNRENMQDTLRKDKDLAKILSKNAKDSKAVMANRKGMFKSARRSLDKCYNDMGLKEAKIDKDKIFIKGRHILEVSFDPYYTFNTEGYTGEQAIAYLVEMVSAYIIGLGALEAYLAKLGTILGVMTSTGDGKDDKKAKAAVDKIGDELGVDKLSEKNMFSRISTFTNTITTGSPSTEMSKFSDDNRIGTADKFDLDTSALSGFYNIDDDDNALAVIIKVWGWIEYVAIMWVIIVGITFMLATGNPIILVFGVVAYYIWRWIIGFLSNLANGYPDPARHMPITVDEEEEMKYRRDSQERTRENRRRRKKRRGGRGRHHDRNRRYDEDFDYASKISEDNSVLSSIADNIGETYNSVTSKLSSMWK